MPGSRDMLRDMLGALISGKWEENPEDTVEAPIRHFWDIKIKS